MFVCLQCAPAPPKTGVDAQPTTAAHDAALAELRVSDRLFAPKVRALVAHADSTQRRAVARELIRRGSELMDNSWLEAARPQVVAADTAAGLDPSPEQLQAQLEAWRTEQLTGVFGAMRSVAAPEHVAFALGIAEDKSAPVERRKAALRFLDDVASASDASTAARREAVRSGLAAEERSANANPLTALSAVVARMREPFRLCFQEQLTHAPGGYRGSAKFTIQPSGDVSLVTMSELPAALAACIEAVIRASHFAPSAEARVVQVPLTFVPQTPAAAAPSSCLPYEPAIVELTGVLERRDYAGPPNYESIEQGDAKETTWLLRLDRQACTDANAASRDPGRTGIQVLQLVFDPEAHAYQKYRPLMGQPIVARGRLFAAQTGHHHTDVLITVSELRAAK